MQEELGLSLSGLGPLAWMDPIRELEARSGLSGLQLSSNGGAEPTKAAQRSCNFQWQPYLLLHMTNLALL